MPHFLFVRTQDMPHYGYAFVTVAAACLTRVHFSRHSLYFNFSYLITLFIKNLTLTNTHTYAHNAVHKCKYRYARNTKEALGEDSGKK